MKRLLSHFNIHVKDMDKAVDFYHNVMGFDIDDQSDDWSELKLNDKVSLSLQKVSNPGSGIGFIVDSCEEATKLLEDRGAEIVTRCDRREEDGIILTRFKDVDGNILWLSERIK